MAMHVDHTTEAHPRFRIGQAAITAAYFTRRAVMAVARTLKGIPVQMQIARMQGVLSRMSDETLQQIGTTRSGIRQHAEKLITGEYDGL